MKGCARLGLNLLAVGSFYTDFDEAWRLCEEAHVAARAGRNTFVLGGARALQAIILHLRDRHAEAEAIIDESVRQCLQHHRGVLSTLLTYQADGALASGDPARALDLAAQALLVAEPLGDYLRVGVARSVLAQIKALTGDLAGAAEGIDPVLRLVEGVEDEVFVPGLDHAVAVLSMRRDDPQAAVTWLQRAAGSTDRGVATWLAGRALPRLGAALAAAGRHDEAVAALDRAVDVARRLQLPGPLAEAYAVQAELAAAEPDGLTRAVELHHAALTIRVDRGLRAAQPDSLEALARIGAAIQPTPDDVRVLYAAGSARAKTGLPRGTGQQRAYDSTAANLRRALGGDSVRPRGRRGCAARPRPGRRIRPPRPRPPGPARHRLVEPHPDRARSRPPRRRRPHQPADRCPPFHEPRHGEDAPLAHLHQARYRQPHRTRRRRDRPRTADRRTLPYGITHSHEPAATTPAGLPERAFLEGAGHGADVELNATVVERSCHAFASAWKSSSNGVTAMATFSPSHG